jgi:P27 family predicted phage terminase small subunit
MAGKPKPTALKAFEGNRGKRPLNNNEPKPKVELLQCPYWLKKDRLAYNEWKRIIPELYLLGLSTNVDRTALELYCSQYSIYRQAMEIIRKAGLTTNNIRDGFKAIPEVAIAREAAKTIKALCIEFGLTPSSRSRISLPGGNDLDKEFEDMLD